MPLPSPSPLPLRHLFLLLCFGYLMNDCFCISIASKQPGGYCVQIYKSTKCNDMLTCGYCPRGPFCAFSHMPSILVYSSILLSSHFASYLLLLII